MKLVRQSTSVGAAPAVMVLSMGRTKSAVAAVLIALALAGCNEPKAGVVLDKTYNPPSYVTQCTTVGKTTTCAPVYYGPSWYILIRSENGETGSWSIPQEEWAGLNVGDRWKAAQ